MLSRQALRYVIRNTTLPARTRAIAQLQLTQMHCYTRPTQIRNRCVLGGKARGVLRAFKMTRVRPTNVPIAVWQENKKKRRKKKKRGERWDADQFFFSNSTISVWRRLQETFQG